jgi:hypothetical protein
MQAILQAYGDTTEAVKGLNIECVIWYRTGEGKKMQNLARGNLKFLLSLWL